MTIYFTFILVFIVIGLIYNLLFRKKQSLQDSFRGPKGFPLLGNGPQIEPRRPHLTFTDWSHKYGDVFAINLMGKEALVLNSFESIYEALVTRGNDFGGRIQSYRVNFLSDGCHDIVLSDMNPRWNLLRKTVHKQIKMFDRGLTRIESVNMAIIEELVKEFKGQSDVPFNPYVHISNAVLNMMMYFVIFKKFSSSSKEFDLFRRGDEMIFRDLVQSGKGYELDLFPWLRYFGNETYKKFKEFKELSDELYALLKQHAGTSAQGVFHALMDLIEDNGNGVTELCARSTIMDIVFTGVATTSRTIYALLNILLHHPEVQKKLQEEVDTKVGIFRKVTMKDKESMPYTSATILETLRYMSITAVGIPHKTLCHTTLQGKHIPPGVYIFTNLFGMHHDERLWQDPYKFQPERFLDDDGILLDPSSKTRRHLMPFGAGPRVCLGEVLAMGRLFLVLATMTQMFEVKPGPVKVTIDPRCFHGGAVLTQPEYELCLQLRNKHLFVN